MGPSTRCAEHWPQELRGEECQALQSSKAHVAHIIVHIHSRRTQTTHHKATQAARRGQAARHTARHQMDTDALCHSAVTTLNTHTASHGRQVTDGLPPNTAGPDQILVIADEPHLCNLVWRASGHALLLKPLWQDAAAIFVGILQQELQATRLCLTWQQTQNRA